MLARPAQERAVHVLRRVDIVGGQLVLELFHEGRVLVGFLALDVAPEGRLSDLVLVAELEAVRIEACQRDIKAGGLQRNHLAAQDLRVRVAFGQQVVGVHERPALVLAQVVDHHAGEVLVAALACSEDPSVAEDQVAVRVNS